MRVQEGDQSGPQQESIAQLRNAVYDTLKGDSFLATWCTESTLRRYLAARTWNVQAATKMLLNTLQWRQTYKPHEIKWEDIAVEATGKQFVMPVEDKAGRQIVIMRPREERSSSTDGQIKFLVYTLEIASQRADASGQGKLTWLVDMDGYSIRNAPSLRVSMQTLNILQSHYPERLGMAVCYHAPRLFSFSFKALQPFIDPATSKKIQFVSRDNEAVLMPTMFPMHKMEACLGGSGTYTYSSEEYSQLCKQIETASGAPLQQTQRSAWQIGEHGSHQQRSES
ncbi:hypothetical protein CVIRNUC_000718 [Coccomyxa viridis]|uniref:CRAL-TRIO domain-containing protein n=1 Tax=Coccomyxa viridis TaxID=1274662 RepID=A0AAV1HSM9_9CHLO|nr:hypothetical protein CVIRNUC_000718 [Coccomyxa viridis]